MQKPSHFIAVDWGTSRLRAFLCNVKTDGSLKLVTRSAGLGVSKSALSFEETLMECISPWEFEYGKLPVLMAGQIGSSIGWKETPYLASPISPQELAKSCVNFQCNGYDINVIPGLSCKLENNNYDCMRGEELQILGWLQLAEQNQIGQHLVCLPGTHTKWVLVEDGKIKLFKTALTGELFDLIANHSVLIQEKATVFNQEAFNSGAVFTLNSETGSLIHGLFSVRSRQLFGQLSADEATSYLSGLLIGSDVRAAMNATEWSLTKMDKVSVIGAPHLSSCFASVLNSQLIATEICQVTTTTLLGFNSVFQSINQLSEKIA
ncbi:MAG: 2-dehydro-3-deoxygalactonokinase [Glaciecola sp.]|jgi:2-dehydro-3-deoxygalactonokinase